MKDIFDGVAKVADVFFNGRKPDPASKVTIQELIARKESTVRVGGKFYKVVVTEMELTQKP